MAEASGNGNPYIRHALNILTNVAHGSAPFITTFLLIHLSAPALANIGGSSLSSQVMVCMLSKFPMSCAKSLNA